MCCGGTVGRMRSLPPMPKVFARWSASPKRFAGVFDQIRGFPVDPPVKSERKALSGGRTSFSKPAGRTALLHSDYGRPLGRLDGGIRQDQPERPHGVHLPEDLRVNRVGQDERRCARQRSEQGGQEVRPFPDAEADGFARRVHPARGSGP